VLALASIFIPMLWERDSYPKHLVIQRHADMTPKQLITKMPDFIEAKVPDDNIKVPYAWVIQVTSLGDAIKAAQLEQSIRTLNYPAFTEQSSTDNNLIRVMVGPYPTQQQAEQISKILDDKFNVKAIIIQYETDDIEEITA